MRGKAFNHSCKLLSIGITPACAGKRGTLHRRGLHAQDHPRMCGEKCCPDEYDPSTVGSPPHVRGKARWALTLCSLWRITPACAGKSVIVVKTNPFAEDHPRICGEKCGAFRSNATGTGSPPHMRGKDIINRAAFDPSRITPAYAGKRLSRSSERPVTWDHPRICGEKIYSVRDNIAEQGSPPHMRGKAK